MELFNFILLILTGYVTLLWTLPLILFQTFKIRLFQISDREKIKLIINKIKTSLASTYDDNDKPQGWIINKKYIIYISVGKHNSLTLWIFTTQNIKNKLIKT